MRAILLVCVRCNVQVLCVSVLFKGRDGVYNYLIKENKVKRIELG